MSYQPYIPRADEAFRAWTEQFARNISQDSARFMLSPAEAQSIMQAFEQFDTAFRVSSNELTRTKATIAAKDDARTILEDRCRAYSAFIRSNRGIDDGDKLTIGVRPRNVSHRRRKCPQIAPELQFIASTPGIDHLRFRDASSAGSARPYGAARLELWVAFSRPGGPRPRREDADYFDSFNRSPMQVRRDRAMDEAGMVATYWSRWVGHNNDVGPWSLPVSMSICVGGTEERERTIADTRRRAELRAAA